MCHSIEHCRREPQLTLYFFLDVWKMLTATEFIQNRLVLSSRDSVKTDETSVKSLSF